MKKFFASALLSGFLTVSVLAGDHFVSPHFNSDGTFVTGHWQTNPNSTVQDNFSYYGNHNPYTGSTGTNHYYHNPSSGYYLGH
jgi:hypothetical protein